MNENKTRATTADVDRLLDSIADPQKRDDARTVCAMMKRLCGEDPNVWGANMGGFGSYRYRYKSGRQGEWFITGSHRVPLHLPCTS